MSARDAAQTAIAATGLDRPVQTVIGADEVGGLQARPGSGGKAGPTWILSGVTRAGRGGLSLDRIGIDFFSFI